ncbi:MAG: HEPN domain-containing protein [Prosthecobacter sp.]|jgi:HEPN domain-containing protein|uniref:HEPN domain-containing protein n=1 Tax=Prosthecobacter sp. TaxID=1965333 RepID=UPI0019E972C6|nr:HEPN domain-containing protein [Prosthecobacter sp.]MBE2287431.1 HEPN domain-containing protein [Prosthecobacter sp.]
MDAELYSTVQAWLTRAKSDLSLATHSIEEIGDWLDSAVYHCQQAAEKALKAFLVSQNESVPKTHDIRRLIESARVYRDEFGGFLADADLLTPLATEFRYPMDDEAPMPTLNQANEALAAARRIYDFVLSVLPTETHPV